MKKIKLIILVSGLLFSNLLFAGPNEDLVSAIKEKNTVNLKKAIDDGADVNHTFEHYLLWQMNRTKFSKFTPLMLASVEGFTEGVLHLLHTKAKPNTTANGGVGAYFESCVVKSVKGVTALHLAAGNGHVEVVKYFMQKKAHKKLMMMAVKANCNFIEFGGKGLANFTPKSWAKKCGQTEIVALWKESKKAAWAKEELPKID